jgi:hypothetical protein
MGQYLRKILFPGPPAFPPWAEGERGRETAFVASLIHAFVDNHYDPDGLSRTVTATVERKSN